MEVNYFTILYWFCHASTWIRHGCTHVPHPEPPSNLPPSIIPLGCPSAPAPSILYPALNLDWQFVSYMILYMFQCHSPKPSHPHPLPQSPKDCSIHLCLFCCLAYRVIIAIFLNSIMLSLNPAFSLSSFAFTKRISRSSLLSAIMVVSSAYLRILVFLPEVFFLKLYLFIFIEG